MTNWDKAHNALRAIQQAKAELSQIQVGDDIKYHKIFTGHYINHARASLSTAEIKVNQLLNELKQ